jgi:signal transduction histidine kinase
MSRKLVVYVLSVGLVAALLLGFNLPPELESQWGHYLIWILIFVISESMWLSTISGEGTWSLSSSATLAACMLWGHSSAMWIAALGTVVAEILVLRKPWMRAWFNGGQMAITMWVAGWAFTLLGGPSDGLQSLLTGDVRAGQSVALRLAPAILGLFAGFLVVNRALVAVAVAWSTDRPYLRVLREDWFYAERLLEDGAAFLLAPLMVISYGAIGYLGVALFYAPLYMIYESGRRYVELRKAQRQIVHTERLAAKGEMAAEIGHELRTQLAAISGHAQMLLKDDERKVYEHVERRGRIIIEQSRRMEVIAKGLMDFSRAELVVERVDLNSLVQRSIEFVRTQNRFDGVEWDLRLTEQVPALRGDPGQLQQVLLNLFVNAADAMKDRPSVRKVIGVTSSTDDRGRLVRIVVTDTGAGIAGSNLTRIFEPYFTTKPEGHGFGLSTSYRIITNHGGRITAESPPGQGACFTVTLPVNGSGGWG